MNKNTINLEGHENKPRNKNVISLQKTVFNKDKGDLKKPELIINKLNNQVVEHIKKYLGDNHGNALKDSFGNKEKKNALKVIIHNYVSSRDFLDLFKNVVTDYDSDELTEILVEKIVGLKVLQPLVDDEKITDIKIIKYNNIWVHHIDNGKYKTNLQFESHEDYKELVARFVYASNAVMSHSKPSVNPILPFMRLNIVGEDLSPNINTAIRLISKKLRYNEEGMISSGFASKAMVELLKKVFASERVLVGGETGTGKTELIRYFANYFPNNKDIVVIEDTPETYLDELYPDKAIMMWRNRDVDDGEQQFGYYYHIRNALRQNIDRIVLQETRGGESYWVVRAASTGAKVYTSLHSDDVLDMPYSLIEMCQIEKEFSDEYFGKRITKAFPIGCFTKEIGNKRVLYQIANYTGFKNGELQARILFQYNERTGEHEQVGNLSEKTWEQMLSYQITELGSDLSTISDLSPYK